MCHNKLCQISLAKQQRFSSHSFEPVQSRFKRPLWSRALRHLYHRVHNLIPGPFHNEAPRYTETREENQRTCHSYSSILHPQNVRSHCNSYKFKKQVKWLGQPSSSWVIGRRDVYRWKTSHFNIGEFLPIKGVEN
jgi:hypothetical protein